MVNCLANATARLQLPLAELMTTERSIPSADNLELLTDSGFALAIQLLGHHEDAADVVQDTLNKLIHGDYYKHHKGSLHTWFLKVVRNGALDVIRKRKPNDHEAVTRLPTKSKSPDISVECSELMGILRQQLDLMPESQLEIILLRDFHDLCYAEIAKVLSIAPGTVMSRLHRARKELRLRMEKYLK